MNKFFARLAALAVMACAHFASHAGVLTFESGYGALSTTGAAIGALPVQSPSGYTNVGAFTSSTYFAYNPNAISPTTFFLTDGGTFDLNSFVIAGAWGTQTLLIESLLNNVVVDSQSLAVSITAQLNTLNWIGIEALRISTGNDYVRDASVSGQGQHWALDNLTFSESIAEVPEPSALLLVGTALILVARRRKV